MSAPAFDPVRYKETTCAQWQAAEGAWNAWDDFLRQWLGPATDLMLDVHQKGRAVVSNGSREEMERDVEAMHGYGLWATLQHDS